MTDYRLAKTERNEVFQMAANLGLDPTSFRWHEDKSGFLWDARIHRIVHEPTGCFLKIDYSNANMAAGYVLDFWPSYLEGMYGAESWTGLRPMVRKWLEAIKKESDAPDLWELARQERAWLSASEADFAANTAFTVGEREQLASHLKTIEEYTIKSYQLNEAHQAHVHRQLNYLAESVDRVGRFDFKNLAASTSSISC